MAKARRVVRQIRPAVESYFDERLWPVMMTLVVLGSFIAGLTVAYLRFDDPRWYANAWTSLVVDGVLVIGGTFVLAQVDQRRMRRAMQLSLLLCTILHLALLVMMHEMEIFGEHRQQANRPTDRQRQVLTIPEYAAHHFMNSEERPQQDYEKPVETKLPDAETQEVARQEAKQVETPTEQPTPTTPVEQPANTPNLVRRTEPDQTVPRQSEQASKMSRQTSQTQLYTPSVLPVPQSAQRAETPQPLDPAKTATTRRSNTPPSERPTSRQEPTTPVESARVATARRTVEPTAVAQPSAAATLPRPISQPNRMPRTEIASQENPSVAKQTAPDALAPANTPAQKQSTASPERVAQTAEPTPNAPTQVSPTRQERQSLAENRPQVAQTPRPLASERTRLTARPEPLTGAADVASIQRASSPQSAPQPQTTQLNRTAREAPSVAKTSLEPNVETAGTAAAAPQAVRQNAAPDQPTAPAASAVASTAAARRQPDRVPSTATGAGVANAPQVNNTASPTATNAAASTAVARQSTSGSQANMNAPNTGAAGDAVAANAPSTAQRAQGEAIASMIPDRTPTRSPARANRNAVSATSPTAAENPAATVAERGNSDPSAEPARMALTKSLSGTAGVGQSPNMDRALAAANSPAASPSAAAQRTRAVQDGPVGPALAPSSEAKVARSRATAQTPGSSFTAEVSQQGTVAGTREPTELNATSGASLAKADSNAERADFSAAKGAGEVDLGATRVVDEGGTGRASGGGQPEINVESQSRQLARQNPGGTAQASLNTSNQAEVVTAPVGDGGGKPGQSLEAVAATANRGASAGNSGMNPAAMDPTARAESAEPGPASSDVAAATGARRNEAGEPGPAGAEESEEEKKRRLAKVGRSGTSGSAPATNTVAEVTNAAASGAGTSSSSNETLVMADKTEVTKSGVSGTGGLDGAPVAATSEPERQAGGALTAGAPVARAEAVDAPLGAVAPGAGTSSPTRASSGTALAAATQAETVSLAGLPASSGERQGLDLQVEGLAATRTAAGSPGSADRSPIGVAGGEVSDATGDVGTASRGDRNRSNAAADGPMAGDDALAAAPVRKTGPSTLAMDTLASIDFSKVDSPSEGEGMTMAPAGGLEAGPSRQQGGAITVALDAPAGAGGLGEELALNVGTVNRRAQADSMQIDLSASRFVRQSSGGLPKLTTAAVIPAEAFRMRATRQPGNESGKGGGQLGPKTEESIELGLAYLARQQLPDGSWRLQGPNEEVMFVSDTAATGLALLAFQGAGYNHREHKYSAAVFGGLDYLVKNQKENGDLYLPLDQETSKSAWLYSHSIAALALCESYGMTQDPSLREPAQKAIDFIVNGQNKELGGWRYAPNYSADTSVSGWMMMALKSGELSGLKVPKDVFANIEKWLNAAQVSESDRHLYRYNPFAPNTSKQSHGRKETKTMTAVGLLMRLYTGWRRDNPHMKRGGEYLLTNSPASGKRDTYYWYYATQVMFHIGGDAWEKWNAELHPMLVNTQERQGPLAGSWNPRYPEDDIWGPRVGRLYMTTMNLLSLEVYYRHLPLYVDVAK